MAAPLFPFPCARAEEDEHRIKFQSAEQHIEAQHDLRQRRERRKAPRRPDEAEFFFFDRAFLENLVIAEYRRDQGDLSEDEFAVLCKLAKGIEALMPRIDKYVYLDCSVQTVLSHMRKRGRDYEDELDLMYVYELKALYDKWAQTLPPERTLRVDMDRGEYDLNEIIAFLEQ